MEELSVVQYYQLTARDGNSSILRGEVNLPEATPNRVRLPEEQIRVGRPRNGFLIRRGRRRNP